MKISLNVVPELDTVMTAKTLDGNWLHFWITNDEYDIVIIEALDSDISQLRRTRYCRQDMQKALIMHMYNLESRLKIDLSTVKYQRKTLLKIEPEFVPVNLPKLGETFNVFNNTKPNEYYQLCIIRCDNFYILLKVDNGYVVHDQSYNVNQLSHNPIHDIISDVILDGGLSLINVTFQGKSCYAMK